jgi:hypothetical protein
MRYMRWSWPDYEATPVYVRRFVTDLMMIKLRCEAERAERRNQ